MARDSYSFPQVSGPMASARMMNHSIPLIRPRFSGTTNAIADSVSASFSAAKEHSCLSFEFAKNREEMDALWAARKEALWANVAVKPKGTVFWGTDVAVPLSSMAGLIGILSPKQAFLEVQRLTMSRCIQNPCRQTWPFRKRPWPRGRRELPSDHLLRPKQRARTAGSQRMRGHHDPSCTWRGWDRVSRCVLNLARIIGPDTS